MVSDVKLHEWWLGNGQKSSHAVPEEDLSKLMTLRYTAERGICSACVHNIVMDAEGDLFR
jgi:hypothetical protein